MRGVLHAEVFGFNFSADINPYQRSDDCVIAAGQITERPRRLSKTSADAPETERGTQVGGTHEHTSMRLSSSEMWLTRSIARNHVQSLVFFLKASACFLKFRKFSELFNFLSYSFALFFISSL